MQRVHSTTLARWREKKQKALDTGEPDRPLIAYADFPDYWAVIERGDNWRDVFAPVFRRKEDVGESFRRLFPVRNCIAHARLITADDELLLICETRRILRAVGAM